MNATTTPDVRKSKTVEEYVTVQGVSGHTYVEDGIERRTSSRSGRWPVTEENITLAKSYAERDQRLTGDENGWTFTAVIVKVTREVTTTTTETTTL